MTKPVYWKQPNKTRYFLVNNLLFVLLPIRVTGVPYSRAEMAVHFPVPFCPALSRILGSRGVPSVSLYLRMLAVISIRKESSSVLFQLLKAWDRVKNNYGINSTVFYFNNWFSTGDTLWRLHQTHLGHLIMVHTQNILHQMIGLTNQLHVTVLDAIMDHFHKMTCTVISNLQKQASQNSFCELTTWKQLLHILTTLVSNKHCALFHSPSHNKAPLFQPWLQCSGRCLLCVALKQKQRLVLKLINLHTEMAE